MSMLKIHDENSAQPQAGKILEGVKQSAGFVPNIFGVTANSPTALEAFATLNAKFAESAFNAIEREVIQLTISAMNGCGYCVAGHTLFAQMHGADDALVYAIRNNLPIADKKLSTLHDFTQSLLDNKGRVSDAEFASFLAVGYKEEQVLELILGISLKIFANLTSNFNKIELDQAFQPFLWEKVQTAA